MWTTDAREITNFSFFSPIKCIKLLEYDEVIKE